MQMPESRKTDHIDDLMEWGEKQYTPWEYAQEGKLMPFLKAAGNKKLAAILFFVQGGACLLPIISAILNSSDLMNNWTGLLFPTLYTVLCLMIATNFLKKWKAEKPPKEERKTYRKK